MLLEGERAERKKFGGVLCLVVVVGVGFFRPPRFS